MTLGIGCIVSIGRSTYRYLRHTQSHFWWEGQVLSPVSIFEYPADDSSSSMASPSPPFSPPLLCRRNLPRSSLWSHDFWRPNFHRHWTADCKRRPERRRNPLLSTCLQNPFLPTVLLPPGPPPLLSLHPESPRYLIRTNNQSLALLTLFRLGYPSPSSTLSGKTKTIDLENKKPKSTSYLDCFKGPISFTLFAEIPYSRLLSRTRLVIVVQNVFGVLVDIVVPLLINPDAADLGGKIGSIFGATAVGNFVWSYFRVPETKGRRYGELDRLFERCACPKIW
jgi:hypothetical protein